MTTAGTAPSRPVRRAPRSNVITDGAAAAYGPDGTADAVADVLTWEIFDDPTADPAPQRRGRSGSGAAVLPAPELVRPLPPPSPPSPQVGRSAGPASRPPAPTVAARRPPSSASGPIPRTGAAGRPAVPVSVRPAPPPAAHWTPPTLPPPPTGRAPNRPAPSVPTQHRPPPNRPAYRPATPSAPWVAPADQRAGSSARGTRPRKTGAQRAGGWIVLAVFLVIGFASGLLQQVINLLVDLLGG
ncbi:hypothetical protein [Nakamurella leprariae]|uniref:Uncharacterized protein n=1 Tax=Nakamurella leprariae TaxID=2803911 RepID=A0A938YFX8_9ACTN|nr:hypothetical protein [Nakamurella leprariae]MBM9467414.1 hypothetical protein [Nakamurella leprariae]